MQFDVLGEVLRWFNNYTELEWMDRVLSPLSPVWISLEVTVDFASRSLYWTEYNGNKIPSSDLDGRGIELLVQLSIGSNPFGIAILSNRIYWGNWGNNKLQSSTKDAQDMQTLCTKTNDIHHLALAIVPVVDQPITRANDCAGLNGTKLCVLSPSSYRCLD